MLKWKREGEIYVLRDDGGRIRGAVRAIRTVTHPSFTGWWVWASGPKDGWGYGLKEQKRRCEAAAKGESQ